MMNRYCDLHTHSNFSDGTASPAQIVRQAAALGLSAVALTDHNTIAGLPEFLDAAKDTDLLAIPGVEISTGYNGKELHILGLFLEQETFSQVTEFLSSINRRKEESNRALIRALNREGYMLDYDQILAKACGTVNRAVIAAVMMEKGYVSSIKEAVEGILSPKQGYYVPPERMCPYETISFLRSIGAVSVLAHPYLSLEEWELRDFLPKARDCGLVAMETRYSTYSPEITESAVRMAKQYGIAESGGSDYHGNNKPDIQMGIGKGDLQVPGNFVQVLQNRKSQG